MVDLGSGIGPTEELVIEPIEGRIEDPTVMPSEGQSLAIKYLLCLVTFQFIFDRVLWLTMHWLLLSFSSIMYL